MSSLSKIETRRGIRSGILPIQTHPHPHPQRHIIQGLYNFPFC